MFNTVAATAVEMAGPAVFTPGQANTLGHFVPFRWMIGFFVAFKYFGLLGRMAGSGWEFFVCACGFVTYKAVYLCLIRKIKIFIFPAIPCMA